MYRFFMLVCITGISYLVYLVLSSSKPKGSVYRQLRIDGLKNKFNDTRVQTILDQSNIRITAQKINLIRIFIIAFYLVMQFLIDFLRGVSLSPVDILIALLFLLATSPTRFAPFGMILGKLHQRAIIKKDSEVISFIHLYENNRLQKNGQIQFGVFCAQMANYFVFIRKDLMQLSERYIHDGPEESIEWFCNQFPKNHAFIGDVRSILIAIEGMNDNQEAVNYLRDQSKAIAKISNDQYQIKWSRRGDTFNLLNAIPSVATMVNLIVLALLYVLMLKETLYDGVNLFL
ncbi:hypothetical protein [Paenibacillus tepidiphilus]|uniref:hypothetical protein n=1 Tax=Paenibacillus tepidiphilus TaxID=2608683 RepID=UPI001238459E|nr:hypothetical protein [Paenibacillus tepidiphilus]